MKTSKTKRTSAPSKSRSATAATAAGETRPTRRRYRIVLVDDHPLIRKAIADMISEQPDLTVCGEASSTNQALEVIARCSPDLAIVDISLPGRDGIELIKELQFQNPRILTLALSMHDERLYAERVLRAGARGYIMKSTPGPELLAAIRQVLAGEIAVGRGVIKQVLSRAVSGDKSHGRSPIECLTDRELEIFRLLGEGHQRNEIGAALHLSVKTVDTHRDNIRLKLGLRHAAEVRRQAVEFVRTEAAGSTP